MKYKNIEINNIQSFKRGGNEGRQEDLHGLIDFCFDNVGEEDTVLELGCFHGASTSIFSHFAKKVISVDLNFSNISGDFLEKHENVSFLKMSSLDLHTQKIPYDLLYIDTVHQYSHCYKELESLYGFCVSSPKKIGGHDYHFDAVKKAVHDFFGKEPNKLYQDKSWYYEKH